MLRRALTASLLALGLALTLAPAATAQEPVPESAVSSRAATPVTKLLVFVVENHSAQQMREGMPFTARLARRYGYATRYRAVTHPSLPNYLAIAGGSTFGVDDDAAPSAHRLPGASVFGRAVRAGSTARLYAEAMGSRCQLESSGTYAVKHNPWAYFARERRLCRADDVPLRRFARDVDAGALPAVGMVIPDLCNDAHDCSLDRADSWLRARVRRAMSGPDWASGGLAIVITADEDDGAHGNKVLTVVAHPDLSHVVVRARLTHYSLSRSYAEVAGVRPLRHAADARPLLQRFGLTTR
ncbi:alkaline phosphatase family protein [Nocardioides sp. T2.26MG-1]|uniref:alkaline phosphatase family protein n=1 Tax=Nocardioides sp. T2.26MG-1 TaxID=3041166 RepID=UPI002477457B|nr:alkaline phosphatase family protein [Nocardioides sp. T2.26MG-1]CAI9407708.1 Phosphatidylinositol-3-phosphatase [Nocardioides sp. T2.26MG-1]